MYERKIEKDYSCGLEITSEIIGGKWKPTLINLIHEGIIRPSELQRAMPAASRRALNIQLNELQEHGIIEKKIYAVLPPKVEYSLTDFGRCLLPITLAMEEWGNKYRNEFKKLLELKKETVNK
ncbi:helix-turn-helix transcriptional regulator [Flavobacterium sp. F-65]|jgi:DNA-binding HxlR family transcriptional regulator|uniref:Helix-turn-helix transcriptional regulator n=1 Tax=Flavobacterium pisciphilum TaxID=2893755 RepID=A0ABS8MR80_9FLAO|nr:helix-turn-helix domain-containing protein [Flavobacterium sp. F-65]MCC9071275.1 helix-turn-helix transcriptional regulator [Flavobacterium sp. F-65]